MPENNFPHPISTAPQDGTVIFAANRCNAWIVEGCEIAWHNGAWCMDFGKEGWVPVRGPFTHYTAIEQGAHRG